MRPADRVPPAIPLDPVPTIAGWPLRPVIGIASTTGVWRDATCSFSGFELTVPALDDRFDVAPSQLVVELDNRDGSWSRHHPDGTPTDYRAGCPIVVLTRTLAGVVDWLFAGVIASLVQHADDTVTVTAFDVLSDLAQPIGTYTAGANGDTVAARVAAILAAAGRADVPRTLAASIVRLTAQPTDAPPLDEIAAAVSSDGGVVWVDADGNLESLDRHWRAGRADQTYVPVLTDNACSTPTLDFVIWTAAISDSDGGGLADRVVVGNVAGLQSTAGAPAGRYVWAETDLQYTSQGEGDQLAADLLADQVVARLTVDGFEVYLFDRAQQPAVLAAARWRRFDRLHVVHDERAAGGGLERVAVEVLVAGYTHSVTAGGQWVISVACTRATGTRVILNTWDTTPYTWDQADPGNVWS